MPILATIPLILPFTLLVVFRQSGMRASLTTAIATLILTLFFQPSAEGMVEVFSESTGKAIAIAAGVLTVLLPGLWLYRLQVITGGLSKCVEMLQRSFVVPEIRILALVISVSPFVESISGFGVCVLVVAPLLIALDIAPIRAGLLVLLSQISIPLGALGVGTMIGAQLADLPVNQVGVQSLILSAPLPTLFATFTLIIFGGKDALRRYWWIAVIAGIVKGTLDPILTNLMGVEVAGALSGASVLILLIVLDRVLRKRSEHPASPLDHSILIALVPYIVLVSTLVLTRSIPAIRSFLSSCVTVEPFDAGFTYPLLYIPGFWITVAIIATIITSRPSLSEVCESFSTTWRQFFPAGTAILGFLFVAQIMVHSGMAETVAQSTSILGDGYVFAAPVLGTIGGWLTGSNSGGNAMFVPLQKELAHQLDLSQKWIIAAQNAAASYGTIGSPARVTLVSVTIGHQNLENELMYKTAPYIVIATLIIGATLFAAIRMI